MSLESFLSGQALEDLVRSAGEFVALGVGVSLMFFMLGYVIWWLIDSFRGGVV